MLCPSSPKSILLQTNLTFNQHLTMYRTKTSCLLILFTIFFFFFFPNAESQNPSEDSNEAASVQNSSSATNFQPSLAVVIGMLSIMFAITFILLLYAKFCHRESSVFDANNHIRDGLRRSRASLVSGLDKTVIESLPVFRFSSLKGSKEGLECAVCLAKFEDVEVLRLLPKCKHAFHIDCIDQWLEKHSTCPLCRQKVSKEDVSEIPYSNSLRFNSNRNYLSREESNVELYVQREENLDNANIGSFSSRFSIGSSFRKVDKYFKKEEELPIVQQNNVDDDNISDHHHHEKSDDHTSDHLHKFNHRIFVSDVVFKNRWSNVSSSDLMFLNSEMIGDISSARFSSSFLDLRRNITDTKSTQSGDENLMMMMMNIKQEMERKRLFESKIRDIQQSDQRFIGDIQTSSDSRLENPGGFESSVMNSNDKRCMSEIVVHPRFNEFKGNNDSSSSSCNYYYSSTKDERRRRIWLPIARKTAKWFANREKRRVITNSKSLNKRLDV